MKKYFGDKAFYMTTISIALPIMGQQFIASFVNLIDNIMIGSVGSTALTSVAVANKIYMLYNAALFGVCGAAGIFISQYYGAKDEEKCQKILDINILVVSIVAIFFMIALLLKPAALLGIFTNDEMVLQEGLRYVRYGLWTYLPFGISFSVIMALRAIGKNKIQLYIGVSAVLINTFLNYVLIFGHFGFPMLGVEGAAIATMIARLIEMIAYLIILIRQRSMFRFSLKGIIHIDKDLFNHLFQKAVPIIANELLYSLGLSIIYIAYVRCDESLVAAISVVDTVMQLGFIIFSGLSSAVAILIGNKLGAGAIDEAIDNSKKLVSFGIMIAIVIAIMFQIIAPYIAAFYNVEPHIKETIVTLIRFKGLLMPVFAHNVCIFFILRSGGDTFSTLLMDSGTLWGVKVVLATLLSMYSSISLVALFMLIESCDLLSSFVASYFFRKENWAQNITD